MTSTRDRLQTSLADALKGIAIADGYDYNVRADSVSRDPQNLLAVPASALPYFLVESTPQGAYTYAPANQVKHTFIALITARMDATGQAVDRKSTVAEQLLANIEKAVLADPTRGGYASDTRLLEPTVLIGMGTDNVVCVLQPVEMRAYRTAGVP